MKIDLKEREFKRKINNNEICFRKSAEDCRHDASDSLTFHFAFGGKVNYCFGNREVNISPGSFLCLRPGTSYRSMIDSPEPVQIFSLGFGDTLVKDFRDTRTDHDAPIGAEGFDETVYPFAGDIKYTIAQLVQLINDGCQDERLLYEYLYHCMINFSAVRQKEILSCEAQFSSLQSNTRADIYRRMNLVREYLYSNYDRPVSLDDLADRACMSVNYLLRMFRLAFNSTPHQFLIQLRLRRSKEYLENTDYPISEIVNVIGLNCTSSFIELFRQRYGLTPLKFRQRQIATADQAA